MRVATTYVVSAANFRTITGVTMGQSSVTVRLNKPGEKYLPRVNQLDMTISKSIKVGSARVSPEISLFNMLNANPVLSESTAYPAVGHAAADSRRTVVEIPGADSVLNLDRSRSRGLC